MIRLKNVVKSYTTAEHVVHALHDVSLQVDEGEFVAVCGPSGCGKSTLLSVTGGLAKPTSGSIHVADHAVSEMTSTELARFRGEKIGFVFQMFHLLPYLTVTANVLVGAVESPTSEETLARGAQLLDKFGLHDRLQHLPGQLSAGERQRVAMARALLNKPQLLLADEPTGNLDPSSADALLDQLKSFQKSGGTILLVTHDQRAAERADRTIYLQDGRLDPTSTKQSV